MLSKALNEKCLRECNVLFSKLVGKTGRIPTEEKFIKAKEELLKRLSGEGDLHNDYANRVIMGYEYAISNKKAFYTSV